jgi:hypothetical protein
MDEELKAALEAMEARLMRCINDNHEAALAGQRDLQTTVQSTRELVLGMPMLVVQALERPLLERLRDVEARFTKQEKPD